MIFDPSSVLLASTKTAQGNAETAQNIQGETMANVKTVLPNLRCTLGEGPHWDAKDGVLYWVDIVGKTAYALRPNDGGSRSWTFDQPVAAIVPRENDGLMVALA
ncbi:MAG: SMP-30/gluconolactonase/LRE family protein, partial [Pseudomonadales bacterium]